MIARPELQGITGLRLELLTHGDLPFDGPGAEPTGTWGILELEVFVQNPETTDWEKLQLANATGDSAEPEQKAPDGKSLKGPVEFPDRRQR